MQTPFLTALLVHPFSLHCFFVEPCWLNTPAEMEKLEHCGYVHFLRSPIPIAMFHRFSLASFIQAVCINHDYVWCFDYVGCWVFGGCCVMWLWRDIAATHKSRQPVMWEDDKIGAEEIFEDIQELFRERMSKLSGCQFGKKLQSFLAMIYWLPYVEIYQWTVGSNFHCWNLVS